MGRKHRRQDLVQLQNPRSRRYVRMDKVLGGIVSYKRTRGPYKGIPIVGKEYSDDSAATGKR